MSFVKNFGIFVIVIGITMTVLNSIMWKINNKNITSLQKSNMCNLVIGVILFVIGVIFYSTGYQDKIKFNFG
jgi:predicted membrane channel-forming protein YqfA (hemolysin III family)